MTEVLWGIPDGMSCFLSLVNPVQQLGVNKLRELSRNVTAANSMEAYACLELVTQERCTCAGECSLEYLHDMSSEQIKAELSRFKGVGKKTVACVLLFCLGRDDFAVDTHVLEIAKVGFIRACVQLLAPPIM